MSHVYTFTDNERMEIPIIYKLIKGLKRKIDNGLYISDIKHLTQRY